jgi:hypothetical protein
VGKRLFATDLQQQMQMGCNQEAGCLTAKQTAQCFSLALYIAKKANFKKSKVLESSEFLKFSIAFLIQFFLNL